MLKKYALLAAAMGLLLLSPTLARAVPIVGTSAGIFVNPIGPGVPTFVTGTGTNAFAWGNGTPFSSPPSSLGFAGTAFSTDTETVFSFGTLTYFNGSIAAGTQADTVDLETTLMLTTPPGITETFTFLLQLINTPNTGGPAASADIVNFPAFFPGNTFFVDGVEHTLEMVGFGTVTGGGFTTVSSFNVLEGQTASTDLLGRVTINLSDVPEPSTLLLFGSGICGLMAYTRRRRAAR